VTLTWRDLIPGSWRVGESNGADSAATNWSW
jgi:hypothetical protein